MNSIIFIIVTCCLERSNWHCSMIEVTCPCCRVRIISLEFTIIPKNSISWQGWSIDFLIFINFSNRNINVPASIYLLKVNNRNTGTRCEICSKLTIKTPERRQWHRPGVGVFIVNFEHISHLVLDFLLLTLNMYLPDGVSLTMMQN